MKTPLFIAALSLGCAVLTASAQPQAAARQPAEKIVVDEFIGPFAPTPESRAEARKEALAAYAWFSRICRQTTKGEAMVQCMKQVRQDRDSQLAYADSPRRR